MKKKICLILIIIIAAVIRFYDLGKNPPALYWDEAALGYNAYSIAQTAKDEEGSFLPIQYIRSFGDFKPPVYVYAAVPMIKIFGLNEWTTRVPSAFFGTLSVILTFYITRHILRRLKKEKEGESAVLEERTEWIAVIAALLLAISPWHVQISRVAYEANVANFLVLLGVWAFFNGLEFKKIIYKYAYFLLSGVSFVLTLYTFNSNRIFTPLLIATLGILYIKELTLKQYNNFKPLIVTAVFSILITLPALQHMLSSQGQLRYKEVNIFSNPEVIQLSNERIQRGGNTTFAKIFNNRRILFAQEWLSGYFSHFSGKFLFISGDNNPRFSIQDVGELYLIELPFLLIGLYIMLSRPRREYRLIVIWLLIAPIPAAFAREVPHALRTLNILPTLQIITAIGLFAFFEKLKNYSHIGKVAYFPSITAVSALFLLQLYYFQHNYYEHYPQFAESEWQYGYKQMVQKLTELEPNYDRVIVTDGLGRPYINVLFYKKYPPEKFQKERKAVTDETGFGFINVYAFNKYQFEGINWKQDIIHQSADERVLLVGTPAELEVNKFTKAVIKNLKGETVFILSETPKGQDALIELNK